MAPILLELLDITKIYQLDDVEVRALNGVSFKVEKGDFIAIMGASGSGKSTLLNLLGFLDKPTSGSFLMEGKKFSSLSKDQMAQIRNQKLGFVFQNFNLLPKTASYENVEVPLYYSSKKYSLKTIHEKAFEMLKRVGLEKRSYHIPSKLSGGQQQRVAIARALVNEPDILLADEPTGNLDTKTSIDVMEVFQQLNDSGITIIMVTHETDIAEYAKRVITMRDGLIIQDHQVSPRRFASQEKENAGNQ
jgi:putative ABC transport system ATP-binding protein